MQWHVTERCNLRCEHCYQDDYSGKELEFSELLCVLDQFKNLVNTWRASGKGVPVRSHITVSGGEPFIRKDFPKLLEIFSANRQNFSFAILTNGTLIDASVAKLLGKLNPGFVQVSIEGGRTVHDKIRGQGTFDLAVSAIKYLVRERIRTFISFTACRSNYTEFPEAARLGRRLKVSRVWADRLIPHGSGAALKDQVMTKQDTHDFFKIMLNERDKAARSWFGKTEIAMHRALQFLVAGGRPYHCTAGDTLITVQPDGDLYPCRRMPIRVGNLMESTLSELYYESELFQELRNIDRIDAKCRECFYSKLCRGGLKCLSYALTGDPFKADPGCWHK